MTTEKRGFSRRDFLRIGTAALGGTVLAACAPQTATQVSSGESSKVQEQPKSEPPKQETVEIIFVAPPNSDSSEELYKPVYDKFRQEFSNINVKWLGVPVEGGWSGYFDKLAVIVAGGSQVDFAKIPTEGGRLAAARGLIVPIDSYIAATPSIKEYCDNVSPKLAKVFTFGGKTYELPYDFNNMMIWVNTKRFQEAELEIPKETWTFNDFLEYARKLTVREGDNVSKWGFQFWLGPFGLCPWLFNNGLDGIMGGTAQEKPLVNDTKFEEVIQLLHGMIYKDKVAPRLDAEIPAKFQDGTIAMQIAGRWPAAGYVKEGFEDCEVVYWPTGTRRVTEVGCGGWAIFTASKYKDQAWTWESFLLRQESLRMLVMGGSNIPSNRALGYDPEFTKYPKNSGKLFYESYDRDDIPVMSVTAPPDFSEMEQTLGRHLTTIFSNPEANAIKAELDACQKELEAMVAKRPPEWDNMFK